MFQLSLYWKFPFRGLFFASLGDAFDLGSSHCVSTCFQWGARFVRLKIESLRVLLEKSLRIRFLTVAS